MFVCPRCGTQFDANQTHCWACGQLLAATAIGRAAGVKPPPASPPPASPPPAEDLIACLQCGVLLRVDAQKTRLCPACRARAIRRPIPWWIWAGAAAILAAMVFNVARIPPKWDALRHRVRAERALAAGDWATAIADYEALLRSIPGTVEDWLGLGHAYLRVGRFDKTDAVLTRFERQRLNVIQRGRWQELDAMLHDRVHNRR